MLFFHCHHSLEDKWDWAQLFALHTEGPWWPPGWSPRYNRNGWLGIQHQVTYLPPGCSAGECYTTTTTTTTTNNNNSTTTTTTNTTNNNNHHHHPDKPSGGGGPVPGNLCSSVEGGLVWWGSHPPEAPWPCCWAVPASLSAALPPSLRGRGYLGPANACRWKHRGHSYKLPGVLRWSWGPGDWWITSFTGLRWFSLVWITSFTGFLWFSLVLGTWGLVNHKLYRSPVIFAGLNHKLYWFPVIVTGPGD